jgi:2-hydroxycyclohexanecarboxyl-CoA dehydrogenase
MQILADKTALITGGASGIGFATAVALGRAGARVVIADVDRARGSEAESRLRAEAIAAAFMPVDVTDDVSVQSMASALLERDGRVEIVVNVAGWSTIAPFVESTADLWRRIVDINFFGTLRVTHAFLPAMIAHGAGKVVNVASDAGRVGSTGEAAYAGAKGGVIAFSKSLAREVARHAINVNCVCPGPTDTPLFAAARSEQDRQLFIRATPFRRLAKPAEIADAVLFFSSSQSDFVTGQVLSVSGGLTMAG